MVLLFDLDGTLIDSRSLVMRASAEAIQRGTGLTVSMEAIKQTLPLTISDRFRRFAPDRVEEVIHLYTKLYSANIGMATPFPGIREMLAALGTHAVSCAVVTSRRRETATLTLRTQRLEDYFEAVICEEDVVSPKPAADPVLAAAAKLGVPPGEAVMIGDSVLDLQSGRAAGAKTGAALWGSQELAALLASGPDYAFEVPADVVASVAGRP